MMRLRAACSLRGTVLPRPPPSFLQLPPTATAMPAAHSHVSVNASQRNLHSQPPTHNEAATAVRPKSARSIAERQAEAAAAGLQTPLFNPSSSSRKMSANEFIVTRKSHRRVSLPRTPRSHPSHLPPRSTVKRTSADRVRSVLEQEVRPLPLWDRSFIVHSKEERWAGRYDEKTPEEKQSKRPEESQTGSFSDADENSILATPALKVHLYDMHAALAAGHTDRVFVMFELAKADPTVKRLHVELFNVLIQATLKLKQPEASVCAGHAVRAATNVLTS
jgi:hypothetical protein